MVRTRRVAAGCCLGLLLGAAWLGAAAQPAGAGGGAATDGSRPTRAGRFLAGRAMAGGASAAAAMNAARAQHLAMVREQAQTQGTVNRDRPRTAGIAQPRSNPLNEAWQAVGPAQIASIAFGDITGRITGIAIDPSVLR